MRYDTTLLTSNRYLVVVSLHVGRLQLDMTVRAMRVQILLIGATSVAIVKLLNCSCSAGFMSALSYVVMVHDVRIQLLALK